MSLIALGINHKTASVDVREKIAFADHELAEKMSDLQKFLIQYSNDASLTEQSSPLAKTSIHSTSSSRNEQEVMILSTCNRVEFYLASDDLTDVQLKNALVQWIELQKDLEADWKDSIYCHADEDAVVHLMRVASGLDSMVLGEPQILGQLKASYQKARRAESLEQTLERLLQKSFSAAKRVRHETEIGSNPVSVAFAAVSLAKHIFADFSELNVLFVGAGETIELAARHLEEHKVKQMVMANRTLANAQTLADSFNGKAISLEAIPHYLPQADIVVSSTGSMLPIIGKGMVEEALKERGHHNMFMVDLAVPRDIESSVAQLDDVYLYTVDDLEGVIQDNMQARQEAAKEAEIIVAECALEFAQWQQSRQNHDTVRELQQKFAEIAKTELARAKSHNEPEIALEELSHRLLKKFLHQPLVWLRNTDNEQLNTHAIMRQMFDLDDKNSQ